MPTSAPAKRHPHLGTPPPGHRCGVGEGRIAHGEIRLVIGAVDETFLQRMMLVETADLATGYLLMEEVAADRSYATWFDRANARLTTFGTEVLYMGSDRAKALIKLAHTGLQALGASQDVSLGRDLAKSYSLAIFGRLRQAKRELEQAKRAPGDITEKHPDRLCPSRPGPGL